MSEMRLRFADAPDAPTVVGSLDAKGFLVAARHGALEWRRRQGEAPWELEARIVGDLRAAQRAADVREEGNASA